MQEHLSSAAEHVEERNARLEHIDQHENLPYVLQRTYPCHRDGKRVTVKNDAEEAAHEAHVCNTHDVHDALHDACRERLCLRLKVPDFLSVIEGVEPWSLLYDIELQEARHDERKQNLCTLVVKTTREPW